MTSLPLLRWENARGPGLNLLSYACLMFAGLHLVLAVTFFSLARVTLPSHDTWWFLKNIAEQGVLQAAWMQYENHRMLIVSLLTYADMSVLGGRYWSGFAILLLVFAAFFTYLAIAIPRHLGRDAVAWRLAFALAVTLVFAMTNAEGFVLPYRAWVPLTLLLATVTQFVFAQHETCPRTGQHSTSLMVVLALAVTATFTGAPGLLIWPALIVTTLLVRSSLKTMGIILITAAVTLSVYFYGLVQFFQQGRGGIGNLLDPFHFAKSLAAVIGAPIASSLFFAPLSQWSVPFAIVIGTVALAATAAIGIGALIRRPDRRGEIAILGILVFALGWVVTSVIKHQPVPPAPWTALAKSSDYMATMVFWAALAARVSWFAGSSPRRWVLPASGIAALGAILLLLPLEIQSGLRLITFKHEVRLGSLAFLASVREAEHPGSQELDYEAAPSVRARIRDMNLPPLDREATRAIGAPLPGPADISAACDGRLSGVAQVQGGIRLWGFWADFTRTNERMVLAVSPDGTVVGAGEWFPKLTLAPLVRLDGLPDRGGWVAYAGSVGPADVRLYGATSDGRVLCRFFPPAASAS